MNYLKKYGRSIGVSALLLFSSTPTKSEPVTFIVGGACGVVVGIVGGYWLSQSNSAPPLPEVAVTEGAHLRQRIADENHFFIQAGHQKTEVEFRNALCSYYQSQKEIDQGAEQLRSSQEVIHKKLEQFQKIRNSQKRLTEEQKEQLAQEGGELQKLCESLVRASRRCDNNKPYFGLHEQLRRIERPRSYSDEKYPLLARAECMQEQQGQLAALERDAQRRGYQDLVKRASAMRASHEHALRVARHDPSCALEKQAKLDDQRALMCQRSQNEVYARQAEKDRAVQREHLAQQTYRNRIEQQRLDLEEGRVSRRIEERFRERIDQERDKARQAQEGLRHAQKALDQALARQRKLEGAKSECAQRTAKLTEQLQRALSRERDASNKQTEAPSNITQCTVEGCTVEGCTGNHPLPSAPPYPEEDNQPSLPVSAHNTTAGGPPPAAFGIKR